MRIDELKATLSALAADQAPVTDRHNSILVGGRRRRRARRFGAAAAVTTLMAMSGAAITVAAASRDNGNDVQVAADGFDADQPIPNGTESGAVLCPGSIERRVDGGDQREADGLPALGSATDRDAAERTLAQYETEVGAPPGSTIELGQGFGWAWTDGGSSILEVEDFAILITFDDPADCPAGSGLFRFYNGLPLFFLADSAATGQCVEGEGGEVDVPSVVGLGVEEASAAIRAVGLAIAGDGVEDGDPTGPLAVVTAQEPPAGSAVPAGACVGLRTEEAPNLTGLTVNEANAALAPLGLTLRIEATIAGDDLPEDVIRSASPPQDGIVFVEVSAGGPTIALEDLPEEARSLLESLPLFDPAEPIRVFSTEAGDAYKVDAYSFGPCAAVQLAYRQYADGRYDDACY